MGNSDNGGESSKNHSPTGAFYSSLVEENKRMQNTESSDMNLEVVCIDASRCSSEYVNEATLQPSALQVLVCIKA